MKTTLDWRLFMLTILGIVVSFYMSLLGKGISYALAMIAITANIVTAYVLAHHERRGNRTHAREGTHLHVFIVFLFVLLCVFSLFFLTRAYFMDRFLAIVTILFHIYVLYMYSYYSRRVWPFRGLSR